MRYGISASGIVVEDSKILLVHHVFAGGDNFWVPPGGKLEGEESIFDCAVREVREETSPDVSPGGIFWIEELVDGDLHFVKFHICCQRLAGAPDVSRVPEDHVVEARFFSLDELHEVRHFPAALGTGEWLNAEAHAEQAPRYLGLSRVL